MAEKGGRYAQNAEGPFYVDDGCIACDACVVDAPRWFKMNDEDGHAFVFAQPKNAKERDTCLEAMDFCPVGAIGDDG